MCCPAPCPHRPQLSGSSEQRVEDTSVLALTSQLPLGWEPSMLFLILPPRGLSLLPPGSSTLPCPLLGWIEPYYMPCLPKLVHSRCWSTLPSYVGTPSLQPNPFRGRSQDN